MYVNGGAITSHAAVSRARGDFFGEVSAGLSGAAMGEAIVARPLAPARYAPN